MEGATSGHRFLNPEGMTPARGFSHGAIPAGGKTFYIAGQTGHYEDSADLVSMTIYTTDVMGYRDSLEPVGAVYREVFGKHSPRWPWPESPSCSTLMRWSSSSVWPSSRDRAGRAGTVSITDQLEEPVHVLLVVIDPEPDAKPITPIVADHTPVV